MKSWWSQVSGRVVAMLIYTVIVGLVIAVGALLWIRYEAAEANKIRAAKEEYRRLEKMRKMDEEPPDIGF